MVPSPCPSDGVYLVRRLGAHDIQSRGVSDLGIEAEHVAGDGTNDARRDP